MTLLFDTDELSAAVLLEALLEEPELVLLIDDGPVLLLLDRAEEVFLSGLTRDDGEASKQLFGRGVVADEEDEVLLVADVLGVARDELQMDTVVVSLRTLWRLVDLPAANRLDWLACRWAAAEGGRDAVTDMMVVLEVLALLVPVPRSVGFLRLLLLLVSLELAGCLRPLELLDCMLFQVD